MKKVWMVATTLTILLGACGQVEKVEQKTGDKQVEKTVNEDESAVKITNYNREFIVEETPSKIISTNDHTTEILLALGLGDKIVAKVIGHESIIAEEVKKEFDEIPTISQSDHNYPALEAILDYEPDFMFGRESAFNDTAIGTPDTLEEYGIDVLVSKGTYTPGAMMEDVYEDIRQLGKIFDIEERAEELITEMESNITSVQEKINDQQEPLKVAVMDMGGEALFTSAQSLETHLIELAGGKNVFDDIEKTWTEVSWEELVKRNPEVIVINEYSEMPTEDKIEELLTNPALQDVEAIKNERFVILPLSSVFEGIQNDDAVELLAKGFYPDEFSGN
ncbi:ABC transporter substrate-binding protein [Bacillus carboniphilus]|uniref:ABC transporter substrate-binding protein n=1 Tax=Bacillus carboniphilus TaxID=86663 RepID=A0ABY9JT23_9BACI|nr:ABC transporter substrate-binding protein [Bacillus carboniphilus]WLR41653.1 ABC transporter substrate-binding protein [Bacillus carboniphilus]